MAVKSLIKLLKHIQLWLVAKKQKPSLSECYIKISSEKSISSILIAFRLYGWEEVFLISAGPIVAAIIWLQLRQNLAVSGAVILRFGCPTLSGTCRVSNLLGKIALAVVLLQRTSSNNLKSKRIITIQQEHDQLKCLLN